MGLLWIEEADPKAGRQPFQGGTGASPLFDIQLGYRLISRFSEQVDVTYRIIFTTAYDAYALRSEPTAVTAFPNPLMQMTCNRGLRNSSGPQRQPLARQNHRPFAYISLLLLQQTFQQP